MTWRQQWDADDSDYANINKTQKKATTTEASTRRDADNSADAAVVGQRLWHIKRDSDNNDDNETLTTTTTATEADRRRDADNDNYVAGIRTKTMMSRTRHRRRQRRKDAEDNNNDRVIQEKRSLLPATGHVIIYDEVAVDWDKKCHHNEWNVRKKQGFVIGWWKDVLDRTD